MKTALICVLIAGLMPYLWTTVAKIAGPRYDNRNVREWQSRLTGMAQRAHAAHLNSFEAFPFFAAAVLAALVAGSDPMRRPNVWRLHRRSTSLRTRLSLGPAADTQPDLVCRPRLRPRTCLPGNRCGGGAIQPLTQQ